MSTIPANALVNVLPNVLSAGGNAININAMLLTTNSRVPIGAPISFPNATAVASYFSASSNEAKKATVYFQGFTGATAIPGALWFTQYNQFDVAAYLRGGNISALTLAQLQALSGSLSIVMDGYTHSAASISLAAATSFSSAAGIIQAAMNTEPSLATFTGSITGNTLTVTNVASGALAAGQAVLGTGVLAGTFINAVSGSAGGTGTYTVNLSQTVISGTLTTSPANITVSYDSVLGAFLFTSGVTGSASSAAFATGTLASSLLLTAATGAVLSQGAAAASPIAFMTALAAQNSNWATFMTLFNPDSILGVNTNKLLFAQWTSGTNKRYAYIAYDRDPVPTQNNPAPTSFGQEVIAAGYQGVCPVWEPSDQNLAAFVCGTAAAINFNQAGGRITFAFKGQAGLVPGVTDATTAANLLANGYNFYGAYATANQQFNLFQNGSVSGGFTWLDAYINQIWLNAQFQLALLTYMASVTSIPYNIPGYTAVENTLSTPINAGLAFGAFSPGVVLSSSQIQQANAAAGTDISSTLATQGWYLQVKDPGPTARALRQTPICNFWYTDAGSIQKITLDSIALQ